MKRRRGMSAEEKQRVILEIMHDNQDVFNYKEIEKLAGKKRISKIIYFLLKKRF